MGTTAALGHSGLHMANLLGSPDNVSPAKQGLGVPMFFCAFQLHGNPTGNRRPFGYWGKLKCFLEKKNTLSRPRFGTASPLHTARGRTPAPQVPTPHRGVPAHPRPRQRSFYPQLGGTRLSPRLLSAEGAVRPARAGRRGRRGRGGDVGAPPPRPAAPHGAGAGAGLRQRLRGRRGDHTSARRRRAWRAPRRPPAAAAAAAPRSPAAPPAAPRRPAAERRRQQPWRSRSGRLRPRG